MHDDLYRARSRRLARRPIDTPFATGTPAMAGYVTSAPSGSNVFLSMNPVTIGGDEVEGGPFTRDVSSDTLIIAGVGKKPLAGMDTIAGFFPHRWANFIRSDTLCDGNYTGSITFGKCFNLGGGPNGVYVTAKRDGILVADATIDQGQSFTFPIAKTGTYVVEWSKPLYQTASATLDVSVCLSHNYVFDPPALVPDSDRVCNPLCPDYPLKKVLTGNDGQGDFTLTWVGGPFGVLTWTGGATRRGMGVNSCPASGPPDPDSMVDVPVQFSWVASNGVSADNLSVYAGVCGGSYPDPANPFNTISYSKVCGLCAPTSAGNGDGSRTCWPFRSMGAVSVSGAAAELWPGGLSWTATE